MKRRFALGLVFYLAAAAGAGLQLDVTGGKARVTGQLDQNMFLILTAGDGATLSNFTLSAAAPLASGFIASSDDFAVVGVLIPTGYTGEGWWLASFPGEPYKSGTLLQADVTLTTFQATRSWQEIISGSFWPCAWFIRTWTEVSEIQKGALSLASLSADYAQSNLIQNLSLDSWKVISLTYDDGWCPEPATLALLGLGIVLIRGRKRIA